MIRQSQATAIHLADVEQARKAIGKTREALSSDWIPCNAVLDALLQEMAELASQRGDSHSLARELRRVATFIEQAAEQRLSS